MIASRFEFLNKFMSTLYIIHLVMIYTVHIHAWWRCIEQLFAMYNEYNGALLCNCVNLFTVGDLETVLIEVFDV